MPSFLMHPFVSHFLAPLALVSSARGACCGPGQFCGGDGKTCFENTATNLLVQGCGVLSCCSCQTSSIVTRKGLCTYQYCSGGSAFALQVTEISGGVQITDRERKSIVSCSSRVAPNFTAACEEVHQPGLDLITVGYDAMCDPRWNSIYCE